VLASANTFEVWNSLEDHRYRALVAKPASAPASDVITDIRERERLLYMMAAMATADGLVSEKERKLLKLCSERWSIPWEKVEMALAAGPHLFEKLLPKGSPEAEVFLSSLVQMALVDGRVDRQERRMLEVAASRLGVPNRLDQLLARK
jgi:uncharacterized membrane protein YebE (DUF533 family)